jgi:hypothetical protein
MSKYLIDPGLDFEGWITCDLPKQLNVSASKERLLKVKFSAFADYVRQLERIAPKEFEIFYLALKKKFVEISKEKAPSGERARKGYGILRK